MLLFTRYPRLALFTFLVCFSAALPAAENNVRLRDIAGLARELHESSGLAWHGGSLWTINDSGNRAELHKMDEDGDYLGSIAISNALNRDWEAMAQDDTHVYIADIGNNFNNKDEFTIYRIAWDSLTGDEAEAERIIFYYGDHQAGNPRTHNFDAEALAVRGDELWLFTKNRGDGNSNLYRLPKQPGYYRPMPSQSLPVASLITGGDIHPDTGELALLGTRRGTRGFERRVWFAPTNHEGVVWDEARSVRLRPGRQWEAIVWGEDGDELSLSHEQSSRDAAGLATVSRSDLD